MIFAWVKLDRIFASLSLFFAAINLASFPIHAAEADSHMQAKPDAEATERGRRVFSDRDKGHCLLCHQLTQHKEGFQGTLGPALDNIATRMTKDELRMRIEDSRRFNPATIMPPYFSVDGLHQVAKPFVGQTVLSSDEIDDLVIYLMEVSKP